MDYTNGITVCIGNYGYYNEGYLHDSWITLPKTEQEIKDFLEKNNLYDEQHEEIYISDYDGVPFGLDSLFTEYTHLDDLNLLAKQVPMGMLPVSLGVTLSSTTSSQTATPMAESAGCPSSPM